MRGTFIGLLALGILGAAFANCASAREPGRSDPAPMPKKKEPSIHGTWVGYFVIAGIKIKMTSTIQANGKYKTVWENGGVVSVETGSYTYADGVLTTEPDGGFIGVYTVTFDGADTATFKGGGRVIVMKRQ